MSKNVVCILRPELTEEERAGRMKRIHDAAVRLLVEQAREGRSPGRDEGALRPGGVERTKVQRQGVQ